MKYGVWNVTQPGQDAVNALVRDGFAPLTAMVLAARGMADARQARAYLDCNAALPDPFLLTDMDKAAARVRRALTQGERIAVYGDYDVDGITATCLLTDFLRRQGADCVAYIPGRLEEGYGLNAMAVGQFHAGGVRLIITVDCGITAMEEAALCRRLGVDLVVTDHHVCKAALPEAVAVVDPHRPDGGYPNKLLSGVGVAFKLAAALCGSQERVLSEYADMVCLGTVADVMPLLGENRVFVSRGLAALRHTRRPGLAALMALSGCDPENLSATNIGYMLAPRINAAGRMGQIDLAVELFMTQDAARGQELAQALCDLNRQRQAVESEIYDQAVGMLAEQTPEAIVLADERWHQGVVGIVASRIAEEYCCPTFLICLDGDHGKASSRSFGGFNLFASLSSVSNLLESYGGHEMAAGFTIRRGQIAPFRERMCQLARQFYADDGPRTVLDVDCAVSPEMLTIPGIEALNVLEPCGSGCPKPALMLEGLTVERLGQVGGGRHMRLRLRRGRDSLNAIFFGATPQSAGVAPGETVDVAFIPQINEYRGERTVQLNVLDIRPSCAAACSPEAADYRALRRGTIDPAAAEALLPDRQELTLIWRYLAAAGGCERQTAMYLCRSIVRWSGKPLSLGKLMTCLDIFADVALLHLHRQRQYITIRLTPRPGKADLNQSSTLRYLTQAKERENHGNL